MNIQELTAYINQNIRNNGVQAITGELMQNVLNSIVATLSDGTNIVPGSVTRGAIAPGAVDNTPTAGSNNLITSTAVAAAIKAIQTVVLENKELTDAELQNIINTANGLTDAVNGKIPISEKGMYGGVATLGEDGRVPASQLPGFVDDVKEGYLLGGVFYRDAEYTDPMEPQGDVIYIDLSTDKEYRWGGTKYAQISESLALGETAETAYAGSKGKQNAEDIERLKTGKQDTLVSGENMKTLNGESILGAGDIKISGGGGAEPISITWAELVALRDAGGLTVGAEYRITDFISMFKTFLSAGHQFDIIVKSIEKNKLSEDARVMLHDGDIYFAQRDLSKWRVSYCIDNDTTRFSEATETGKGYIYWMKDDNGIECPFDFKNRKTNTAPITSSKYSFILDGDNNVDMTVVGYNITNTIFNCSSIQVKVGSDATGYKISDNIITANSLTIYVKSNEEYINNVIEGNSIILKFSVTNITAKKSKTLQLDSASNIFIYDSSVQINKSNNGLVLSLDGGLIQSNTSNFVILPHCKEITIERGSSVLVNPYCNNIKISCDSISIKSYINIGMNCNNITLQTISRNCIIGANCSDITIFVNSGANITIGANCKNIKANRSSLNNVRIGDNCTNIQFNPMSVPSSSYAGCSDITIGEDCQDIELLSSIVTGTNVLKNVAIANSVKLIKLTSSTNISGVTTFRYFGNLCILQGGKNQTYEEINFDTSCLQEELDSVPIKFATRNSAGEYKVFVLGDLAPA